MEKSIAKLRTQQAAHLLKALNSVWDSLDKIPSFAGKARFMDKVRRAQVRAHNLHWNLDRDQADLS
jgi:hypothetical protein